MTPVVTKPATWITRRRLLTLAGLGAAMAVSGLGYARWVEPEWVEVVRHDLPIRGLPADWIGKVIAQVSDLHVGHDVDSGYLMACLRRVAGYRPDVLVITGDLMTCADGEQIGEVARVLKECQIPGHGAYVCLGNHDYGRGWAQEGVADALSSKLTSMGFEVLRNRAVSLGGLQLVGLDDLWGPRFAPAAALKSTGDEPRIVLCHNPDAVDVAGWGDYRGWILSGHTHGGQGKLPFLPPPILPVKNKRYTAGRFDLRDGRMLYINRGLGCLHSVRINARPEITLHRLTEG